MPGLVAKASPLQVAIAIAGDGTESDANKLKKITSNNVIASYFLVSKHGKPVAIDLEGCARRSRRTLAMHYGARMSKALTLSLSQHDPSFRPTISISSTGKVTHSGDQSMEHARLAAHTAALHLSRVTGVQLVVSRFRVTNIASVMELHMPIALPRLVERMGKARAVYNPKSKHGSTLKGFPAVFIRSLAQPRVMFAVHASGKVVVTGAARLDQIAAVIPELVNMRAMIKSDTSLVTRPNSRGRNSAIAPYRGVRKFRRDSSLDRANRSIQQLAQLQSQ